MEVTSGEEEGFVREWAPCSHMLSLIPPKVQTGLFSKELCITCIDAVSEFIALGTNIGLVYWYDRKKGNIQRLRCESSSSPITFVKIVNTVDYMVGAGNTVGQVTVFQIPKQHPDNVPDNFKPKVEPKVERYTIGDLHKSPVTAIEWSKNGMRLFSGDKNGVIIMTEIDFYMHLCKSMEIVNENHEIVQLSCHGNTVLVSSLYRSILCERRDHRWTVSQVGKKERKSLCSVGGVIVHSYVSGQSGAYCGRPGLRLWKADLQGEVYHTLLFKDAISNPMTIAELLNPAQKKHSLTDEEHNFGPLYVYREDFLVSHNDKVLFILDPRTLTAVAVIDQLRRILSVSVNKDEIFIVEGPRSVVRVGHSPEPGSLHSGDISDSMTRSLTSSIQNAVNTFCDLTIEQTVPFISSVLEQPISMFTKNEVLENDTVINGEECFELPPIKTLPAEIAENVLESIVSEFHNTNTDTKPFQSEELERKIKLYNSIMEKKIDADVVHSRSRSVDAGRNSARNSTPVRNSPREVTPVRKSEETVSYTSPCVMDMSIYSTLPLETDENLEREIEEKEKILAKMLNIESLSIKPSKPIHQSPDKLSINHYITASSSPPINHSNPINHKTDTTKNNHYITETSKPINISNTQKKVTNDLTKQKVLIISKVNDQIISKTILRNKTNDDARDHRQKEDFVPKLVELPNNWNLGSLELTLENNVRAVDRTISSPDAQNDDEWEFV